MSGTQVAHDHGRIRHTHQIPTSQSNRCEAKGTPLVVRRARPPADFTVVTDKVGAGSVIRLVSASGRSLVARTVHGQLDGDVGLSAEQREELRVNPGDLVFLEDEPVSRVRQVKVVPLFSGVFERGGHAAHLIEHAVTDLLRSRSALVMQGTRFRVPLSDRGPGALFRAVEVLTDDSTEAGLVGEDSLIALEKPGAADLHRDEVGLDEVGGLKAVIEELRQVIEMPLLYPELYRELGTAPPRGILLYGPPGSGKTYVARAVAASAGVNMISVSSAELIGSAYGESESNIRDIFASAASQPPSMVVIDEIDAIAPRRRTIGSQTDYRLVAELLAVMDGMRRLDGVIVMATTNRPDAIDPALRRPGRFDFEIVVPPPSATDRLEILEVYGRKMPLSEQAVARLHVISDQTHGYVPADLMAIMRQAALLAAKRIGAEREWTLEEAVILPEDLEEAHRAVRPSLLRGAAVRQPSGTFADVVGHITVTSSLERLLQRQGERPARVLLSGAPGTGKSLMANAVADRLAAHLLVVSPADLFSSWLGETEEGMRGLFDLAALVAPAVVLLSPLEGFAPRSGDDNAAVVRVAAQLLHELDSFHPGIHVIAESRDVTAVDPAVLQRFNTAFELQMPTKDDRKVFLRRHAHWLTAEGVDHVADQTVDVPLGRLRAALLEADLLDERNPRSLITFLSSLPATK